MAAGQDPLAGLGTPVGPPAPPAPSSDPLAGIGEPVQPPAAPQTAVAQPPQQPQPQKSLLGRIGDLLGDVGDAVSQGQTGVVKGAMQTGAGALHLVDKVAQSIPVGAGMSAGLNRMPGAPEQAQHASALKQAADWLQQHAQSHGIWQELGGMGESMAELLTPGLGEEAAPADAAKAMSYGDKLAEAAKSARFLEKTPAGQKLASLAAIGMRTVKAALRSGVETGAQTLVKTGGNTDAATQAGVTGAVVGGALHPLAEAGGAAARWVRRRATTLEDVGGVQTPIPAEVRNARPTPQQAAGQASIRNAAQDTAAQRLAEVNESRAVPEVNPARTLPARTGPYTFNLQVGEPEFSSEGNTAAEPRKKQIGTQYVPGKGSASAPNTEPYNAGSFQYGDGEPLPPVSDQEPFTGPTHKEPVFQYMSGTKPGTENVGTDTLGGGGSFQTQDPNIVKAHISHLNDVIDSPDFDQLPENQQQQLRSARESSQAQLAEYNQQVRSNLPGYGKPNFDQIDIPRAIQKIGSYSDAADHLEGIATDGYNSISDALDLNGISGGKFNQVRNANKAAWKAYKNATTPEAFHAAGVDIDATNRQMDELLQNDIGGAVSPKELSGFNDAYRQAQRLRFVGDAIDRAFSGNGSTAARSWEYRGFNGQALMSNLNGLEAKFGRAGLERVVGADNLNTLYRVAELNRTGAARGRFGAAVKAVAESPQISRWLHVGPIGAGAYLGHLSGVGYEAGAAMGAGAVGLSMATRRVMDSVLTNPNIAKNLMYALENGVPPEKYGPMIGAMITQAEAQRSQQEPEK